MRPHPEIVPRLEVERAGHPEAGNFALKLALHPEDPPSDLATVSAGLEQLVLAALSEERLSRPPAEALAIGFSAATGDKAASRAVLPTPSVARTERASQSGPPPEFSVPWWLSAAGAAVVGGLVVLVAVKLEPPTQPAPSDFQLEKRHSPVAEAASAGVADEGLSSVAVIPRDLIPYSPVGMPFPKTPFPGQKKSPCTPRFEKEVLGVCWSILKATPPCGENAFDRDGECLHAVIALPPPTTSEQP